MIQQYDEEQILLERRVQELESQIQQETVKKADTERFLALVRKYCDCTELTDAMLYSFIDRVEVHKATGGRTIYRQQNIDIHFNFIGRLLPTCWNCVRGRTDCRHRCGAKTEKAGKRQTSQ
ncbi:MAG: DUF4368 domain-containing protein [Flavonifractor plautii]